MAATKLLSSTRTTKPASTTTSTRPTKSAITKPKSTSSKSRSNTTPTTITTNKPASQTNSPSSFKFSHLNPPTPHQRLVYTALLALPPGTISTYASLSAHLSSSPRAIGSALRNNPFCPYIPCHRIIASNGYVGGYKGEWQDAPSGVNQTEKMRLLEEEGVVFDERGKVVDGGKVWFGGKWDGSEGGVGTVQERRRRVEELCRLQAMERERVRKKEEGGKCHDG